jgi:hypothetical protein
MTRPCSNNLTSHSVIFSLQLNNRTDHRISPTSQLFTHIHTYLPHFPLAPLPLLPLRGSIRSLGKCHQKTRRLFDAHGDVLLVQAHVLLERPSPPEFLVPYRAWHERSVSKIAGEEGTGVRFSRTKNFAPNGSPPPLHPFPPAEVHCLCVPQPHPQPRYPARPRLG